MCLVILVQYAIMQILDFYHTDINILKFKNEKGSKITLDWFDENHMKAKA